ncbi:MAG TPA: transposase [Luteolibacter sp.]
MPFTPYNRDESVHRHRQNLPHWRQWGRTYFVTTRLIDSIPHPVMERWKEQRALWLTHHGLPPDGIPDDLPEAERTAFHREFTARFHELLDAGHGECLIAHSPIAEILTTQLKSGHGTIYQLNAWVIMPNHFHALVEPLEKHTLGSILQRWKGASARAINQNLGRTGSLWQAETFDHIVRSEAQLDHYRRYIAENPCKAGLKAGYVLGLGDRAGIPVEDILRM